MKTNSTNWLFAMKPMNLIIGILVGYLVYDYLIKNMMNKWMDNGSNGVIEEAYVAEEVMPTDEPVSEGVTVHQNDLLTEMHSSARG